MRRVLAVVLSVLAALAFVAPDASAQAPTAKVTINGLVDNVTSYTRNLSIVDLNFARQGDTEWYFRTRVRPDITGEVGTTKFVLGLEIDATWGQTGANDTAVAGAVAGTGSVNRSGTTGAWDLNTDGLGQIEVKWAYTEFDVPGIPFATRMRLGAQPWQAQYKLAALANGDFAGIHVTSQLAPPVKLNATWASVEEESTGPRDGFVRGEDHAWVFSVEITPFKGLDIRPIYSLFKADSVTNGAARQPRGGLGVAAAQYPLGAEEWRHTLGADMRWRMGPFSLDPTIFYQWGTREIAQGTLGILEQDRSAWFVDIRGGFQTGPLLLELAAIWTTGNRAQDDVRLARTDINYYEPISTDTSYYATWAEQWALGIDYFNILNSGAAGLNPGVAIGYDKYGLRRLGARASYAVTPAFTLRAGVTANWTDEKVDTNGTKAAATGITPGDFRGNDRYLGTELDLGFQWRFAPGLAFDVVGSYGFNGDALGTALATSAAAGSGPQRADRVQDSQALTARLRYNF